MKYYIYNKISKALCNKHTHKALIGYIIGKYISNTINIFYTTYRILQ